MEASRRPGEVRQKGIKLALAVALVAGCGGEEGRVLRVAQSIPLPDSAAATLSIDPGGAMWLGAPGRIRVRGLTGATRETALPGGTAPRVVGWMNGVAYLQAGDSLLVLIAGSDSIRGRRGSLGEVPILPDVRGRAVLQGARSGAVIAHHPATLEPLWAWGALGTPTAALASSPEGDRIYHALGSGEHAPRMLIRDLQTGRTLAEVYLPAPLDRVISGRSGRLYAVAQQGRRAAVLAFEPGGGDLHLVWRTNLPMGDGAGDVRLELRAGRLAVRGLGGEVGLRVLNATDGSVVGRTRSDPLDVCFDPRGRLWALYPGEVRRLE